MTQYQVPIHRGPPQDQLLLMIAEHWLTNGGEREVTFTTEDGTEVTVIRLGLRPIGQANHYFAFWGIVENSSDQTLFPWGVEVTGHYDSYERKGTIVSPGPDASRLVCCDNCHQMVANIATCTNCGRVMCP